MAAVGASGISFSLDGYNSSTNMVTAPAALNRVTEFGGVDAEGIVVDVTALGDDFEYMGATGQRRIATLTLGGIYESGNDGAWKRIGAEAARADYPARTLLVTYASGVTQSFEVIPTRRKIMPAVKEVVRWEADFQLAIGGSGAFTDAT